MLQYKYSQYNKTNRMSELENTKLPEEKPTREPTLREKECAVQKALFRIKIGNDFLHRFYPVWSSLREDLKSPRG